MYSALSPVTSGVVSIFSRSKDAQHSVLKAVNFNLTHQYVTIKK